VFLAGMRIIRSGFTGLGYAFVCVSVTSLILQLVGSSNTNLLQLVRIVIPILPCYGCMEVPRGF